MRRLRDIDVDGLAFIGNPVPSSFTSRRGTMPSIRFLSPSPVRRSFNFNGFSTKLQAKGRFIIESFVMSENTKLIIHTCFLQAVLWPACVVQLLPSREDSQCNRAVPERDLARTGRAGKRVIQARVACRREADYRGLLVHPVE